MERVNTKSRSGANKATECRLDCPRQRVLLHTRYQRAWLSPARYMAAKLRSQLLALQSCHGHISRYQASRPFSSTGTGISGLSLLLTKHAISRLSFGAHALQLMLFLVVQDTQRDGTEEAQPKTFSAARSTRPSWLDQRA